MKKTYYTVYLSKNDEVVASGNAEECRKQMGKKSLQSFYSLVSKSRLGKRKKYIVVVDDIEY